MDAERARIKADLGGVLAGEVRCDPITLQLYSTDASIYQVEPLAVVHPTSTDDVVRCVDYANQHNLSLYPRGAGTSVNGGPLGPGIVLDFSVRMRRILRRGDDRVRVQPGVVLAQLNRQLKRQQRLFGPDPALRSVTTIGGVLATDASGSHWLKYGSARDKVLGLQVVTATGDVLQLDRGQVPAKDSAAHRLASATAEILDRRHAIIQQHWPETRVNRAGYPLRDLEQNGEIDLIRLFAGSAGTLGIITQAELQLDPIPQHRGVVLFFFQRMEQASHAALEVLATTVATCDLMDRRLLSLAREENDRYHRIIPANAEAMLLVECDAESNDELLGTLQQLIQRIEGRRQLAFRSVFTTETAERNLYWRLIRRVVPSLYRMRGSTQAVPFVEEVAVAPERLPEYLADAQAILNEFSVTGSVFAHMGQGVVQLFPFLDLSQPADRAKLEPLAGRLYERVLELRGTISGLSGDGLSRTWFLRRQYGKLYDVLKEVKRAFDPRNLLNPGKIVDEPRYGPTDSLRRHEVTGQWLAGESAESTAALESPLQQTSAELPQPAAPASPLQMILPVLNWQPQEMYRAANQCNGCGRCRTGAEDQRMCPIFRLNPLEEASPRAKANLVRGLLTGSLSAELISTDELKSVADLCVHCHQCRLECPAAVDIPKLMVEAKAQYVAKNGLMFSQWFLTRLDLLIWLGTRWPWVTNRLLASRGIRWLLDRFLGVAQARKLPRFATHSLTRWAARRGLHRPSRQGDRRVLYFLDSYSHWCDVELGRALIRVLQHNGVSVFVPPNQDMSGMSLVCDGLVERAREIAQRNVERLADHVRQGYHIVTAEPSAALAIQHEYPNLLDDPDAALVARHTSDACSYLWQMHMVGQLELDFKPLNAVVGYHLPCHQRAISPENPGRRLLSLVPGLVVESLEHGCSGMAGLYGMKRQNYRRSLRAGLGLMSELRRAEIIVGATECTTCKIQMEHGTTKPTIHPIKILALAYRLMPELEDLFKRQSGVRTLS